MTTIEEEYEEPKKPMSPSQIFMIAFPIAMVWQILQIARGYTSGGQIAIIEVFVVGLFFGGIAAGVQWIRLTIKNRGVKNELQKKN